MNPCRHVPNGLGARNENGLMVCGRCGHGYTEDRRHPTFVIDAETKQLQGVLVACPARVYGPFLGSDATYLSCSELDGHVGQHSFSVKWGAPVPITQPADAESGEQHGEAQT